MAASSSSRYESCAARYTLWATENALLEDGMLLLPSEEDLVAYVAHLATPGVSSKGLKYGTILNHLSGLSSYWLDMVRIDPCRNPDGSRKHLLRQCLRGIRRSQIRCKKTAEPLTSDRLKMLVAKTALIPNSRSFERGFDDLLVTASATTAVYGLLRIGEFSSTHVKDQGKDIPTHDSTRNLCWGDVEIYYDREASPLDALFGSRKPTHATIFLKDSKTDVFRDGSVRRLHATGTLDCPVAALDAYRVARLLRFGSVQRNEPFFIRADGKWLTREWFTDHLRFGLRLAGLKADATSSHSCRAGGACSLLASGASDAQVQLLGRWTSSCFLQYLQLAPTTLIELMHRMSTLQPQDIDHAEHETLRQRVEVIRMDAE